MYTQLPEPRGTPVEGSDGHTDHQVFLDLVHNDPTTRAPQKAWQQDIPTPPVSIPSDRNSGNCNNHFITSEELLLLPSNRKIRSAAFGRSRRYNLFSALTRRQRVISDREQRRRRQASERNSVEVLGGLLHRSARSSCIRQANRTSAGDGHHLILLRAGCIQPAVQRLYQTEEVGLRRAVTLTENAVGSDLDSGVSEWGSDDDGETAAFEMLLAEQTRMSRQLWTSPPSTPTSSATDSPPHRSHRSRRSVRLRRRQSGVEGAQSTTLQEDKSSCKTTADERSAVAPLSVNDNENNPENTTLYPQPPLVAREAGPQVPLDVRTGATEKRSQGAQCTSPPVDKSIQTTGLRLPRKSAYSRDRILHPRPAVNTVPIAFAQTEVHRNSHPRYSQAKTATAAADAIGETGAEMGEPTYPGSEIEDINGTTVEKGMRGSKDEKVRSGEAAGRVHVRLGGEILGHAKFGQLPTVWAVSRRKPEDRCADPVIMVQLEPGEERQETSPEVQRNVCLKRFLHVTDFAGPQSLAATNGDSKMGQEGATEVKEGDKTTDPVMENADRSLQLEGEDRGASDSAQNFGPREERECEEWRRCRLDPLWDGLGSLGERLASVDDLFNQLEQDLDHDQQVVETFQKQSYEEMAAAALDMEQAKVRRREGQQRTIFDENTHPKVPFGRSPSNPDKDDDVFTANSTGVFEDENALISEGVASMGDGGHAKNETSEDSASVAAEKELREARELLGSINRYLKSNDDRPDKTGVGDKKTSQPLPPASPSSPTHGPPPVAKASNTKSKDEKVEPPHPLAARRHLHLTNPPTSKYPELFQLVNPTSSSTPSKQRAESSFPFSRGTQKFDYDSFLQKTENDISEGAKLPWRNEAMSMTAGRGGSERSIHIEQIGYRRQCALGTVVAHFPTAVAAARARVRSKRIAKRRTLAVGYL